MNRTTLKLITLLALLASPSAFAAVPGPGTLEGAANTVETAAGIQLAGHGDGSRRWYPNRPSDERAHDGRRREFRGDRGHRVRGDRGGRGHRDWRPRHRGHRHPYYRGRGHRHHRHYHGWPPRRIFRYMWNQR